MTPVKFWLRWLTVLPGAILAGILAIVPLHFILYRNLSDEDTGYYPESPERILTPLVISAAFVYAGSRIAPTYKFTTAVVLSLFWFIFAGWTFYLVLNNPETYNIRQSVSRAWPILSAVCGPFVGIYVTGWRKEPQT